MKRLPFEHRFCVWNFECFDFEPRHALDVPGIELAPKPCIELTFRNEQLFQTREQALKNAAESNGDHFDDGWQYAREWSVVVELLPQPDKWVASVTDAEGISPHGIPFRIVKPTKAEREAYGKRRKLATA